MIFHIVKREEWEEAVWRGRYAPASLRDEGFIHCSTPAQVIDTANRFYRGQRDLVVLWIEEARLRAEMRWEAPARAHRGERKLTPDPFPRGKGNQIKRQSENGEEKERVANAGELFPHLYGELNVDAVVRVIELVWEEDRGFRMGGDLIG